MRTGGWGSTGCTSARSSWAGASPSSRRRAEGRVCSPTSRSGRARPDGSHPGAPGRRSRRAPRGASGREPHHRVGAGPRDECVRRHPARGGRDLMARIRVLLADDHAVLRAGLRVLINGEPDMEVVGEASTGEEAVGLALAAKPGGGLLALTMPGGGGGGGARGGGGR